MKKVSNKLKYPFLILGLAIYLIFMIANFSSADPQGADVTNLSTETYSVTPEGRADDGGTITTVTLDVTQQNNAWKAYVGNITGALVLRDSDGWSIYEWVINSSGFTGNIYASRNDSVAWDNLKCANDTILTSENTFFGMSSGASDNINNTFNYTIHKEINTSTSIGTIANGTCPSTATYVNGSAQTISESAYFQEILLYDNTNLIYHTFIDQDAWGFDNNASGTNVTYDFQLIVAENSTGPGTTYYFYAEISN
ncbi:hypothetical protein KY348_03510 [Candidatus Woesearchaeota archaeon]|nr:hypothetical protein [Candidatus Woesearchaeota archaeon]